MASCALLALAACASNNTQVQPAPKADYEVPAVYFDFNSTALTADAQNTLSNALNGVENTENLKLVITGYADMYGDEDVNMKVSQKRAESVKDYLRTLSVPEEKMVVKAKGKSELASTNPDAQDAERRVEVAVKDARACKKAAAAAAAAGTGAAAADQAKNGSKDDAKNGAKNNAKKANKGSDQPWYSVLFDCMCED